MAKSEAEVLIAGADPTGPHAQRHHRGSI